MQLPMNKTQQGGFTLIELVMVIVILGILAAAVVPNFVNLKDEARQAAVEGVAGSISSAFAINYAAVSVGTGKGVDLSGDAELCDIASFNSLLSTPIDATAYTVTAGSLNCSDVAVVAGDSASCTLADASDNTKVADLVAICAK